MQSEHFRLSSRPSTARPFSGTPTSSFHSLSHTDASDTGLGAILSQTFHGEEHLVHYISRKLTPDEQWAIEELGYYLAGCHFTLVTMAWEKDMNARLTRWFLSLQDFSFQVQH